MVDAQVTDDERRLARLCRLRASENGVDSCEQLGRGERFRHVVVGADPETLDLVLLGPFRRQHDDRPRRELPDPPAHLEAVEAGQHHVQDHQVGVDPLEEGEPLLPARRRRDAKALLLEVEGDHAQVAGLVIDRKDVLTRHATSDRKAVGPAERAPDGHLCSPRAGARRRHFATRVKWCISV